MSRPSYKFHGTLPQLQRVVSATGFEGRWETSPHGHQYRCSMGAILNWWPSTGTLNFQGPAWAAAEFESALAAAVADLATPPRPLLRGQGG
jgi:hypothetical protein